MADNSQSMPFVASIGALLFVSARPLTAKVLARSTDSSIEEVEKALKEIGQLYSEDVHGFSLCEVAGAWQFRTSPAARLIVQSLIPQKARKLSRAAAETLAVVAYKQPVQRAEVEAIRGVDALPTLKTLLDARLIRIVGRESTVGHPALYGTTSTFLEKFGLSDLSELPTIRELNQLAQEPGESEDEPDVEIDSEFDSETDAMSEEATIVGEELAQNDGLPDVH